MTARSRPSAAQRQAAFLRALADHLDSHDLPAVTIDSARPGDALLHVVTDDAADASAALAWWARSLGVRELRVRPLSAVSQVDVDFTATLAGHPVRVWGCVDALREAMGLTGPATIALDDLGHFARHSALPEREANR